MFGEQWKLKTLHCNYSGRDDSILENYLNSCVRRRELTWHDLEAIRENRKQPRRRDSDVVMDLRFEDKDKDKDLTSKVKDW